MDRETELNTASTSSRCVRWSISSSQLAIAAKETLANTATIASDLSTHLFRFDISITRRMSPNKDTSSKALPRVLYAVVLDPSLKFGSLEEQIIRLARAFELHDSLFYPL